jgi:hypothetical protein
LLPAINVQHRSNLTDGQFRQESENRPVQREFSVDMVVSAIPSIRSVSFEHLLQHGAGPGTYGFRLRREVTSCQLVQDFASSFARIRRNIKGRPLWSRV